jgi:hypothetical protein
VHGPLLHVADAVQSAVTVTLTRSGR